MRGNPDGSLSHFSSLRNLLLASSLTVCATACGSKPWHFHSGKSQQRNDFGVSKFAAVLTTIPQCVLGGATVTVFSTIAMTGMKLIASQGLTARNTTVVGLSAALGVGVAQAGSALSQFPEEIAMILGKSPVVIATIMAVLLNLILPKETKE